jgi:hypothetical protein
MSNKTKAFFNGLPFPIKWAGTILIGFGIFKLQPELLLVYIGGVFIWALISWAI